MPLQKETADTARRQHGSGEVHIEVLAGTAGRRKAGADGHRFAQVGEQDAGSQQFVEQISVVHQGTGQETRR